MLVFLYSKTAIFFHYFVGTSDTLLTGTNDMLVGLHVPTNFQMNQQNSDKALLGGGGGQLPPLPPFWLR